MGRKGTVAQQIFNIYCEQSNTRKLERVERSDSENIMRLHYAVFNNRKVIEHIPLSVSRDKKNRDAIPCNLACTDSLTWFPEVVRFLFDGKLQDYFPFNQD
jgi:hypothetical protein